jgi:predicted ATPase/DNA-binding winged helix-turn-helix (wHTH) protein
MNERPASLTFGRFRFSPEQRALWVDGEPAHLGARAFDVLAALIERRERLVTKSELLDVVWPNMVVEENNLQVQISTLRRLLGQDVIETVPGRGYRFAATLEGDQKAVSTQQAGGTGAAAPLAARTRTNLPMELAPLFGRDGDMLAVRQQVQEHRLVTIVGAGGIGKTRVGQAVAHGLREDFAQGVWLIELAPVSNPALVAASVAQALGHQLRSADAPIDELIALLRPQQLLLLIDNCEHLLDAVSRLVDAVLDAVSGVHMLVTSQEALRVPGERLYRLGALDVPGEGEPVSAEQALEHGAVQLFVKRTQALDSRFALDERNVRPVIDICRQLDGLALAIEMAAARVPALGVQGVRERLGERLRLLTAGSRIALRRHQTLRAALDWSHGLLDEQDQTVFRRLGVFSGGCTIEAAQQVAHDEQLDKWAVLDAIGRLVDKSLVVADAGDKPRYRMLESARAYALEKLAAAQETDLLARRHASCYAAYVERINETLFAAGGTEDGFIAARATEFDNFRAALKWSLGDDGDADISLALLGYASPMAFAAVSRAESETFLSALKQRVATMDMTPRQAALRYAAETLWGFMAAYHSSAGVDVLGPWHLARERMEPLGQRRMAYYAYTWAVANGWRGDIKAARAVLDEVRQLERSDWPAWLPALRLTYAIWVSSWVGDSSADRRELPAMLARLQKEGDIAGRAAFTIRTHLAADCLLQGRFEEAAERLLALAEQGRQQRRDSVRMLHVFRHLIVALAELKQLDHAHAVVVEAMPLVRWFGWRAEYSTVLGFFAAQRGRLDTAARLLAAGRARRASIGGRNELIGLHAEHRTRDLLAAAHGDEHLDAWFAEGSALTDEEFDRLVIEGC